MAWPGRERNGRFRALDAAKQTLLSDRVQFNREERKHPSFTLSGSDRDTRRRSGRLLRLGALGFLGGFPVPGQQLVDPLGRMIGQARERLGEPGLRIDAVQLAGFNERIDARRPLRAFVRSGEGPIAPSNRNLPFILPITGRKSRSTTTGIRCMGAGFTNSTASSAPAAGSSTSRRRPAWSSCWPSGCSMLPPALAWRGLRRRASMSPR
jgi:hypothetical protein